MRRAGPACFPMPAAGTEGAGAGNVAPDRLAPNCLAPTAPLRTGSALGKPLERGEHVLEPGQRHPLVGDAASEYDVLELPPGV